MLFGTFLSVEYGGTYPCSFVFYNCCNSSSSSTDGETDGQLGGNSSNDEYSFSPPRLPTFFHSPSFHTRHSVLYAYDGLDSVSQVVVQVIACVTLISESDCHRFRDRC